MIVVCKNCKQEFEVDESKLPPRRVKSKCLNCGAWIYLREGPLVEEAQPDLEEGFVFLSQGKWEEGRRFFQRILNKYKSESVRKAILEKYLEIAGEFASHGNPEQAKMAALEGLGLFPDHPQLLSILAAVWEDLQNFEEAKRVYQRLLELDPKNDRAYIALANLYSQRKEIDKEVEVYERAVKELPKNASLRAKLAAAYLQQGEFAKCLKAIKKAVEIDRNCKEAYRLYQKYGAIKEFAKAVALFKKKKFKDAMEVFQKLEGYFQSTPLFFYYAGVCHYMLRQFDKALEKLEKYLYLDAHGPKTEKTLHFIQRVTKAWKNADVKVKLHPVDQCHLIIQSKPKKVEVYLDGQRLGKTPLNILEAKAGHHTLRAVSSDGLSMELPLLFNGGIAYKIHLDLTREDVQITPSLDFELVE